MHPVDLPDQQKLSIFVLRNSQCCESYTKPCHIIITLSSYETGRNQPSFDMLIQYADYFNVTTDYLLGRVPFDMSPSVFTDSFIDNVTIQDVISILQKLPDNRRRALLVLLGDIQLSSTIQEQAKKASKGG